MVHTSGTFIFEFLDNSGTVVLEIIDTSGTFIPDIVGIIVAVRAGSLDHDQSSHYSSAT